VAARRLAYQRALAKRQAQSKESLDGEAPLEEPTLDIEQVNQQSLRLIRLALLGGFLVCLYAVWADLIGVFTYLDTINLYEYSSGTGDNAALVPISLMDVIGALIIVAITVALARNLPGLLEVLVLSRMRLAQGSAYATTTLLTYTLIAIGIVSTPYWTGSLSRSGRASANTSIPSSASSRASSAEAFPRMPRSGASL
jgi:potassium efflux system protein